jgi:beta-glucosidase
VTPVTSAVAGSGDSLYEVSFDVTNTGSLPGVDVAQIYVGEVNSKVVRPIRELKGFARSSLQPGERRRVKLPLNARSLAYYDTANHSWRADAGSYRIELGDSADRIASSAVLRLSRPLQVKP